MSARRSSLSDLDAPKPVWARGAPCMDVFKNTESVDYIVERVARECPDAVFQDAQIQVTWKPWVPSTNGANTSSRERPEHFSAIITYNGFKDHSNDIALNRVVNKLVEILRVGVHTRYHVERRDASVEPLIDDNRLYTAALVTEIMHCATW